MIRSLRALENYRFRASDGEEIGDVTDSYLDSFSWQVRYLAVGTGNWLNNRRVLLSPASIQSIDDGEREIQLNLSKEQLEQSPEIPREGTLTRAQEEALHQYFEWPFYWDVMHDDALGVGSLARVPLAELAAEMAEEQGGLPAEPPLQNTHQIFGYSILARDGDVGSVEDFLLEDEDWNILYIVVDTGGWLSGRNVLISPTWVEQVDRADGQFIVDLKRETIENSPEYDPEVPLNRDYENRLYEYYGRDKYW